MLAQEKVTKEKGTPPSGPGCAGVPSLHHHSRGTPRRAIPGPSWLSRHPCRSTPSTAIPLGLLKGTWASFMRSCFQSKGKTQSPRRSILRSFCKLATRSPSGSRVEALRRGASRMDAAKYRWRPRLMGQGWPIKPAPGAAPERGKFRVAKPGCRGALLWHTFLGQAKKRSAAE